MALLIVTLRLLVLASLGAPLLLLGSCGSRAATAPVEAGSAGESLNPVAAHGKLAVVGTQLQDESGQPVQLKGVSSQWLNFESRPFPESRARRGSRRLKSV